MQLKIQEMVLQIIHYIFGIKLMKWSLFLRELSKRLTVDGSGDLTVRGAGTTNSTGTLESIPVILD